MKAVVVMRTELGKWWISAAGDLHQEEKQFVSEEQVELELVVLGWSRTSKTYAGMLPDAKLFDIEEI